MSNFDNAVGVVIIFRHTPSVARYIMHLEQYEFIRKRLLAGLDVVVVPLADGAELVLRLPDVLAIQQELPNEPR